MGMLDITDCSDTGSGRRAVDNTTNIHVTLSGCLEGGSIMAFGGAFAGDVSRYGIFAFMLLTVLLTVLGNAAILTCVAKSRLLKCTNYSVYVVSLAISDLVVGLICLPAMAVYTVYGYWPLGSATCTAFIVCDAVSTSNSNLHLNVIALDIFRAVADPLKYRSNSTKSRARRMALVPWLVCILFYFPGVIVVRILDGIQGTSIQDQCSYPRNIIFFFGAIGIGSYSTVVCLIILNIFSIIFIRRRNENTKVRMKGVATTDQSLASVAETEKIRVQNRRSLLTLLAQIALFLMCWVPWMIVVAFLLICEECLPATVFDIALWMGYANSTLNPIAYFMFNKDYRTTFSTIFGCPKKSLL